MSGSCKKRGEAFEMDKKTETILLTYDEINMKHIFLQIMHLLTEESPLLTGSQ